MTHGPYTHCLSFPSSLCKVPIDGRRVFKYTKSSKSLRERKIKSKRYFYISILVSISLVDLNRESEQPGLDLQNNYQRR